LRFFRIRSLTLKLMLILLVVALSGAMLLYYYARQATQQEFGQYVLDSGQVTFINTAAAYYEVNGSWSGIIEYMRSHARTQTPAAPDDPSQQTQQTSMTRTDGSDNAPQSQPQTTTRTDGSNNEPQQQPPQQRFMQSPWPFLLVDKDGYVVWPAGPYREGDLLPQSELVRGTEVKVNDAVVGTVLTTAAAPELDPREQQYLDRTNQALIKAALGAAAFAMLLGFLLARTLTTPLRELTMAIRAMAHGKLNQAVPVRSKDELGELAVSFNQMSADLARSNELRRQMTADIAHDLRTPLSVITGYLESLRDGVLKPTPERLDVLYGEAQHLNRLVDDLRTLSLADARELPIIYQRTQPAALLERLVAGYQHQAERNGVALCVDLAGHLPAVEVDVERMVQVLSNLVSNALRYTPPGGRITLGARQEAGWLVLTVQDTGTGIAPEVLPHVFERFYRGDRARTQSNDESGLGLAIAKSIVELHGGQISATSDGVGKGSTFAVRLPIDAVALR
jgi:two-component system sensor histidine kinase BaeS